MALALSIIFGSFVLEDAALASAVTFAASGRLSWAVSFLSIFLGISIGDIGLFAIGRAARRFGFSLSFFN